MADVFFGRAQNAKHQTTVVYFAKAPPHDRERFRDNNYSERETTLIKGTTNMAKKKAKVVKKKSKGKKK
jgi:hypothetical protein